MIGATYVADDNNLYFAKTFHYGYWRPSVGVRQHKFFRTFAVRVRGKFGGGVFPLSMMGPSSSQSVSQVCFHTRTKHITNESN